MFQFCFRSASHYRPFVVQYLFVSFLYISFLSCAFLPFPKRFPYVESSSDSSHAFRTLSFSHLLSFPMCFHVFPVDFPLCFRQRSIPYFCSRQLFTFDSRFFSNRVLPLRVLIAFQRGGTQKTHSNCEAANRADPGAARWHI